MNSIIIVEGAQGSGKTTVSNWIRENKVYTNLYRLTGHNDNSKNGREKSIKMYDALMDYVEKLENSDINLLFDRTFITEMVYCMCGYRKYMFADKGKEYIKRLNELGRRGNFEIVIINLKVSDADKFRERFLENDRKDKPRHLSIEFNVDNSIKQQESYEIILEHIKNTYKYIDVIDINTDKENFRDIVMDRLKDEWVRNSIGK